MDINTATRQEAFDLHGYVSASLTPEHFTVIHPEVDMLYISRRSAEVWGTSSLKEVLQACNALERVRSVAFHFEVEKNPKLDLVDTLRHCTSLEVVFVVMKEHLLQEYLAFDQVASKLMGGISLSYRTNLQAKIARGPQMLAPRVILVSEQMFDYGNAGNQEGSYESEFSWQKGQCMMSLRVRRNIVSTSDGGSEYLSRHRSLFDRLMLP
jgi:hypothetical protein